MAAGGIPPAAKVGPLASTPSWLLAAFCTVIVFLSIIFERGLRSLGKYLVEREEHALFEALMKIKEDLMVLGFVSLLLTMFQEGVIQKICIPKSLTRHMSPCGLEQKPSSEHFTVAHIDSEFVGFARRRLAGGEGGKYYCTKEGEVPLLSQEAIHQLHYFIFALAFTHVVCSLITVILGSMQVHGWKHWEDEIQKSVATTGTLEIRYVHHSEFIQKRFKGLGKYSFLLRWMYLFCKQFYGTVSKSEYTILRLGFIRTRCEDNEKIDFHEYMKGALEADFEKVVSISWYLWVFVMIFLFLDVNGWHIYFWIKFIPLLLLLALGTKMEHIITQLAHEVAEKHHEVEGESLITRSDDLFWFHRPRLVFLLIHFILFQNAFEIAYYFWILPSQHLDSCKMDEHAHIIIRIVISVVILVLCSYCTLPLYAIVTQMGSTYKEAIFDMNVKRLPDPQVMSTEPRENPVGIEMQIIVPEPVERGIVNIDVPKA